MICITAPERHAGSGAARETAKAGRPRACEDRRRGFAAALLRLSKGVRSDPGAFLMCERGSGIPAQGRADGDVGAPALPCFSRDRWSAGRPRAQGRGTVLPASVRPDSLRYLACLSVARRSGTPDQVRGDEICGAIEGRRSTVCAIGMRRRRINHRRVGAACPHRSRHSRAGGNPDWRTLRL